MSTMALCDCEDCYNNEIRNHIYPINTIEQKFLQKHRDFWFKVYIEHICDDCMLNINEDYKDFFIIEKFNKMSINKEYINHPALLDELG